MLLFNLVYFHSPHSLAEIETEIELEHANADRHHRQSHTLQKTDTSNENSKLKNGFGICTEALVTCPYYTQAHGPSVANPLPFAEEDTNRLCR
jgi:hypothetical protein